MIAALWIIIAGEYPSLSAVAGLKAAPTESIQAFMESFGQKKAFAKLLNFSWKACGRRPNICARFYLKTALIPPLQVLALGSTTTSSSWLDRFEGGKPSPNPSTLAVIKLAFEAAGVEFISSDAPSIRSRRQE